MQWVHGPRAHPTILMFQAGQASVDLLDKRARTGKQNLELPPSGKPGAIGTLMTQTPDRRNAQG